MANSTFDRPILTVRVHAGLNAQSFLAGLLALTASPLLSPQELLTGKFPGVAAELTLENVSVHGISGVSASLTTPPEGHVHRHVGDILSIYEKSKLSEAAKARATDIWTVLAKAEARVHGADPADVHFHEVGRLSNVLAVGLIGELIHAVNPETLIASPLPMGDGAIRCAHGDVPNPAPATLAMMDGVAVRGFDGEGEAVTPTGLACLLGLGFSFGPWPQMRVRRHATAFQKGKIFEGTPNGSLFLLGDPFHS